MHHPRRLAILVIFLGYVPAQTFAASLSYGSPAYAFSYPSSYQLKEYTDAEGRVLGQTVFSETMDLPEWVLQIQEVEPDTTGEMTASRAIALARNTCDADGHKTSIHCPDVALLSPLRTSEVQGFRMMLREETRNLTTGAISSRLRGPVYVVAKRVTRGGVMISYNAPERPQRRHLRLLQQILTSFVGD